MSIRNFIIVFLLWLPGTGIAQNQDSLLRYYRQYPEKAITEAEHLYEEAVRNRNAVLLLRSLMLKTAYSTAIDRDRFPTLIREAENIAAQEQDPAARCILYSYIGQLYLNFYQDQRYLYDQRTTLQDYPEDMKTWSGNLFRKKVMHYFRASLVPARILQETPVGRYASILITAPDSASLRPTLYDLLCHRAIDFLASMNSRQPDPASAEYVLQALSPLPEFLRQHLPDTTEQPVVETLKIYRSLLSFRQQETPVEAFVIADLERLDYAYHFNYGQVRADTLYATTLAHLASRYADLPVAVEIWYRQARLWMDNRNQPQLRSLFGPARPDTEEAALQKALSICEQGIARYPHYRRINLLHQLIRELKTPRLSSSYPNSLYPGEEAVITISYKNLSGCSLKISQVDMNTFEYEKRRWKKKVPQKTVFSQEYSFKPSLIIRDTTIRIPALHPGLYELSLSHPEALKVLPGYFVCTRLFTTQQRSPDGKYVFSVRDAMTGKPVKDARIYLYRDISGSQATPSDTLQTNTLGIAETTTRANLYQATDARNPNGVLCHSAYLHYPSSPSRESQGWMITDRKLYRPGQTVYFKGILWRSATDTLYPLTRGVYKAEFYNPQHKVIGSQSVRTDDFGSFTGSFQIPRQTLNGSFRITVNHHSIAVNVAEYKRPEFEISFEESSRHYRIGDTVLIKGRVSSFSGVPVSSNPVEYKITAYSRYSWFPTAFGNRQGSILTDEQGNFELRFPVEAPTATQPPFGFYYYRITATTTDAKGETQSHATEIPVFTGKYMPQVQVPQKVDKNQRPVFRISLQDFPEQGDPRPATYSIARLKAPAEPVENPELRDTLIETIVQQGELKIAGTDSLCPDLSPYPSGAYLLTVDCDGSISRNIFYLYARTDRKPPIPTYNWLIEEKTDCRPGEPARVLFGSSLQEVYLTYEIYSTDRLILRKQVILSDEVISIEIPYRQEYGRQLWLCLHYVRNGKYIQDIVPITRTEENRKLKIETVVFRDKLNPGQEEEWTLRVTDARGLNADAEVLAMMYDASLDKIIPYEMPDFYPDYLSRPFDYSWYPCHKQLSNDYLSVYKWSIDTTNYPVPPFLFDRLNTYTLREPVSPFPSRNKELYNFMDYGTAEESMSTGPVLQAKAMARFQTYDRFEDVPVVEDLAGRMTAGKETSVQQPPVYYRQDFRETAFFYPQLRTDSAGKVNLKFRIPEATTRWKFYAMASTRKLSGGHLTRYVVTNRELMVRPNLPRFFRSGDRTEVRATISNLSEVRQKGQAWFELFLPATDSVLLRRPGKFDIPAGKSQTVGFSFDVPGHTDAVGCRISAGTAQFSDGEQQWVPVLPDQVLITRTLPFYATTAGTHTFTLEPQPAERQDYRLTLELTSNPVWYAVMALPPLTEPRTENITDLTAAFYANTLAAEIVRANPKIAHAIRHWQQSAAQTNLHSKLEQNEELKAILLEATPWVLEAQDETESIQALSTLFDRNRLTYLQARALEKLQSLQTASGAWSWFKGMSPSHFQTCQVLITLARANTLGQKEYDQPTKEMQLKAIRYLDREINDSYKQKPKQVGDAQLLYLYVRSLYRDVPLGDAREAHKYFLSLARQQWDRFSLYEKAITAQLLHRYGIADVPGKILESLRQYAVSNAREGMYWPENRRYSSSRNSAVRVETAILEAFAEIEGKVPEINAMKQWLLNQKQTQAWGSVPVTVDAIHALLTTGTDLVSQQEKPEIRLGKQRLEIPANTAPLGYLKVSYPEERIKPDLFRVTLTKQTDVPSWGALYLQYFTKPGQVKPVHAGLNVEKQLFIAVPSSSGANTLIPLSGNALKTGDRVVVRLTFSLDQDMEFIVLKDQRAACFEPVSQVSGNRWKFGTVYYEDVKDTGTHFFFNALQKGSYVLEYTVTVDRAGEYQDGITNFQCLYAPEYNAYSATGKIEVKE